MAETNDTNTSSSPTSLDNSGPANIPAATEFSPSGAPIQIVPDVNVDHPAVDNDPRKNTTILQNKIDFNDPTKAGEEVVAEQLGMKNQAEAADEQADLAEAEAKKAKAKS